MYCLPSSHSPAFITLLSLFSDFAWGGGDYGMGHLWLSQALMFWVLLSASLTSESSQV